MNRGGEYLTPYDRLRNRVFDPSPTAPARRYYPQEEQPLMSNKIKRTATNVAIKLGVVGAIVALVAVADTLQHAAGRKWL